MISKETIFVLKRMRAKAKAGAKAEVTTSRQRLTRMIAEDEEKALGEVLRELERGLAQP